MSAATLLSSTPSDLNSVEIREAHDLSMSTCVKRHECVLCERGGEGESRCVSRSLAGSIAFDISVHNRYGVMVTI